MTQTDTVPNPITAALARMTTSERTILRAFGEMLAAKPQGGVDAKGSGGLE